LKLIGFPQPHNAQIEEEFRVVLWAAKLRKFIKTTFLWLVAKFAEAKCEKTFHIVTEKDDNFFFGYLPEASIKLQIFSALPTFQLSFHVIMLIWHNFLYLFPIFFMQKRILFFRVCWNWNSCKDMTKIEIFHYDKWKK
jgi:hypothetical protein